MKMNRFKYALEMLILTGLLAVSVRAQTIVDTFSDSGGAWTSSNQPDFVAASPGGGTLYTDQAILEGTNNSGSNTGAVWTSTISSGTNQGSGLYGDYYYTFFSTPAISISTTNVLAGVDTITFTLVSNATFTSSSVGLTFNGTQTANDFDSEMVGYDSEFNVNIYLYTWTWDVSTVTSTGSFSLDWTTPGYHTAYFSAEVIQAVPEPSTYALMALGLGFFGFGIRRKLKKARDAGSARLPRGKWDRPGISCFFPAAEVRSSRTSHP